MFRRDIAKTHGSAAVTSSSSVVVPVWRDRRLLKLQNQTDLVPVYVKLHNSPTGNPTATATAACYRLQPGETLTIEGFSGAVAAICASAASLNVLEV